jgi:phytol kinase
MIHGAVATVGLIVGLVGAMAVMSRLVAAGAVHPEVSRKALHVCMGLSCLALPWVFPDPVWFAIGFTMIMATLAAVRYVPAINRQLTGALHAVERSSGGDIYFAASVAILYAVARDQPALYVMPLLVLTLADALAALAGVFYAKTAYESYHARKSWEGSLVFFVVAFLCIHLTVLLLTDLDRVEGITVSFTLAYVATLIEGASWEGLDNLFLPVALYLLLDGFMRMNVADVAPNVGLMSAIALVGLTATAWIASRLSHVPADATMATVAFAFIFWTVTEFALIVPGLIAGIICVAAPISFGVSDPKSVRGRSIAAACAPIAGLVIVATQGIAVPLILAGHAAFAATVGYVLPMLRVRTLAPATAGPSEHTHDVGGPVDPVIGAALGIPAGALILASWLVFGDHLSATSAALIIAPAVLAGAVGGTAWSLRGDENTRLAMLLAIVTATVVAASLFGGA